jgi:hypothetical protein
VLKQFILGSLLVAGLTACPIEPIVPPQPASPKAIADLQSINPNTATSITILPADNDIFDSSASRVLSSIDLDASKSSQQFTYDDSTGKGKFSLNTSTGAVTFKPNAGKTGTALATYTIRDSNGNTSNPAKIEVTISTVVLTGPIKVLFIGNSRTKYEFCESSIFPTYSIPQMLEAVSANESRKIVATTVTNCGKYLQQHYNDGTNAGFARAFLAVGGWDYVVLQAHTDEVAAGTASLKNTVQQFQTEIQRTNPNAKIILYENWRKLGFTQQTEITPVFEGVASSLGTKLAPVGRAWVRSNLSDVQLFNDDQKYIHATTLGAYTAASTFYWMIYKKDVPAVGVPSGLFGLDAAARSGAKLAYNEMTNPNFK